MEVQPKGKEIQEEIAEGEPSSGPDRSRSPDKEKSPWQTGVHIRSPEEERPSQTEEMEEEVP